MRSRKSNFILVPAQKPTQSPDSSFLVNHIYSGSTKDRTFEKKRKLLNAIGYQIGKDTKIVGPIYCTAKLTIGNNCWVGKNFFVNGNGSVEIGDNCDIAPEVAFQTGGHLIGSAERRAGTGANHSIKVGNGTWLGARSTIVNSVSIGNSCVVAACSCVVKDVPDNCLVGGVPAKIIREL